MSDELWQAKVKVVAAFASGPGIIASLEVEFESMSPTNVVSIDRVAESSGGRTEWDKIAVDLRAHRRQQYKIPYSKYGTATSIVSKMRTRYDDIDFFAEAGFNGSGYVIAALKP
jgi:hypothetical protein